MSQQRLRSRFREGLGTTLATTFFILGGYACGGIPIDWASDLTLLPSVATEILGALGFMGFGLAVLGTLAARSWARWPAVLGFVMLSFLMLTQGGADYPFFYYLAWILSSLGTLLLFSPGLRAHHESLRSEGIGRILLGSVGALAAGALLLILILGILFWVVSTRHDVTLDRTQRLCSEGDENACGLWAIHLMKESDSAEDLTEAVTTMDRLCSKGIPRGCRHSALLRASLSSDHPKFYLHESFIDQSFRRSAAKCRQGEEKACVVAMQTAALQRGMRYMDDDVQSLLPSIIDWCHKDKYWACRAVTFAFLNVENIEEEPKLLDATIRACKGGFTSECAALKGVEADLYMYGVLEGCRVDPSAWYCSNWLASPVTHKALDEDYIPELKRVCYAGGREACAIWVQAAPELDPLKLKLLELFGTYAAEKAKQQEYPLPPQLAWRDIKIPDTIPLAELQSACDDDMPEACYALGLAALSAEWGPWLPALPKISKLKESLGKACKLGFSQACLTYGSLLLDRPITELRDTQGAKRWLDIACDRGHSRSCQLKPLDKEFAEGNFIALAETHLGACTSSHITSEACQELISAWAAELQATPYVFSDKVLAWKTRNACSPNYTPACSILSEELAPRWHRDIPIPEMFISAFDASALACRGGDFLGCKRLNDIARYYPIESTKNAQDIREKLCSEIPGYCDAY